MSDSTADTIEMRAVRDTDRSSFPPDRESLVQFPPDAKIHTIEEDAARIEAAERANPTPPPERVSMSRDMVQELINELQGVRAGQVDAKEQSGVVGNLLCAVLALQEQTADVASGVTAILHNQVPEGTAKPLLGKRVLLVEDSELLAPAYFRILEDWGAEVVVRCDYLDALHWLDDAPTFHVALVDVRLPGGSGITLAERIADEWPEVAIVLASGFKDPTYKVSAASLNAELIGKPHTHAMLLDAIKRQLGRAA